MTYSEKRKALRDQRRNAGLCPRCGGEPEKYHILCARCGAKNRAYAMANNQANKAYYRSLGICPSCGTRAPEPGRIVCAVCMDK